MTCTIQIKMDNEAFEASPVRELGRILTELGRRVAMGDNMIPALDANGNRVGVLEIEFSRDDLRRGAERAASEAYDATKGARP